MDSLPEIDDLHEKEYEICVDIGIQSTSIEFKKDIEMVLRIVGMLLQREGLSVQIVKRSYAHGLHYFMCLVIEDQVRICQWMKDHDLYHFVHSLSGSAMKQQQTLAILQETSVPMEVDGKMKLEEKFQDLVVHYLKGGKKILKELKQIQGISVNVFPLHNETIRKKLLKTWSKSFGIDQPIKEIFEYFGPKIAMYFSWLGFYTKHLILPAICGIVVFYHEFMYGEEATSKFMAPYSMLLAVGASIFVDSWKRKQIEVEYQCNYVPVNALEEQPRSSFIWVQDPISKCRFYEYPEWKRLVFRLSVSTPIVIFMFLVVVSYVLALSAFSDYLIFHYPECQQAVQEGIRMKCTMINYGPSTINAVLVDITNRIFVTIATYLNQKENYRTEIEFEEQLILKIMPFYIANSYASLFYLAFYVQDLSRLKQRMWVLMVVMQLIDNVIEIGLPFLQSIVSNIEKHDKQSSTLEKITTQRQQLVYSTTFDDYKEMLIQFGYVTLFAPVFPLAPAFALANNLMEMRSDSFKLLNKNGFQRPFVAGAAGIGMWETMLRVLSTLSVLVNSCLIGIYGLEQLFPGKTTLSKVIVVVIIEHLTLAIQVVVDWEMPSIPSWVHNAKRNEKLHAHAHTLHAKHPVLVKKKTSDEIRRSSLPIVDTTIRNQHKKLI